MKRQVRLNRTSSLHQFRRFEICIRVIIVSFISFCSCTQLWAEQPADWFQWRGPEANGISREKNLPETWSTKGENVLWAKEEYASRSTPITLNGRLYIVTRYKPESQQEGEQLVCLNADTGEEIWSHHHNVFLSDAPAERVGWSSPIADPKTGYIYWLGLGCQFVCLNGETGETVWEHAMSEEYGMLSTYGGRTNFPIVFDDLVIISGVMTQWGENAVPAHRFVAFDKKTGGAVWFSGTRPRPEDTTYSTPFLTTFNGQAAMVFGAGDGFMYAMQPRTGRIIWKYDCSNRGINTPPLVVDGSVYCGHREQNSYDTRVLGAIFALNGNLKGEIKEDQIKWKIPSHSVEGSQPMFVNGRLYVIEDGGNFVVIDPENGNIIFEKKIGRRPGSMVYGDGKIYACEQTGNFWIFEPTEDGVKEIKRIRTSNGEEILASPIISGGKIFLATTKKLYCIGSKDAVVDSDPIPAPQAETQRGDNDEVAHIQIAPVEAMLAPGQSTPYQVRAYNSRGQFIRVVEAEFSTDAGTINANGVYAAPAEAQHSVAMITAKFGELSSTARVRVLPDLPWSFDFSDKKVPVTWIGAAYRHQPKEMDGESMLVKIATIPKGTRSQSWMGWTTLHDYTIEAEVYSTANESNGRRADMGLINQRYTLDLMDKDQLQIRSWTPRLELRFAKSQPFEWSANQWYHLKFQAENQDGKVTLRGKAWRKGEPEPEQWTVEATDETPNATGSPGLFGNSSTAEFYIDNVKVYRN
ncbi:MAG: PQQ-binding-like beta-propeller repeat protein [Planctomycetales bacterium]|nr:PQQ-binding-like beta-propeller repeat protein [Planctomycetales bacterium]